LIQVQTFHEKIHKQTVESLHVTLNHTLPHTEIPLFPMFVCKKSVSFEKMSTHSVTTSRAVPMPKKEYGSMHC